MAINNQFKYLLCAALVILLLCSPAAAKTGSFIEDKPVSHTDSDWSKTLTGAMAVNFNDLLIDVDTIGEPTTFSFTLPIADWDGSVLSTDSETCWFKIGGSTIGEGTTFFSKTATVVYIVVIADSIDFTGYSGVQYIDVESKDGSNLNMKSKAAALYSTLNAPTYGTVGYFGERVGTSYIKIANHASIEMTTASYYEFENAFEYYNRGVYLTFDMNRTASSSSKIIITSAAGEILNETALSYQTTDLNFNTLDYTNLTWDMSLYTYYGTVINESITFDDVEPQLENTIEWGADSYVVDDTGSYAWSLSDDNWDTVLYSKKASIYQDETLVHEVTLPTQAGTMYYTFEDERSYTVKLRHTSILLPHKTIDLDTVNVNPIGESFIAVTNATVYINSPIGFQFSYGFAPSTAFQTGIEARKLIDGNWIPVNYWSLPGSISGNINATTLYDYTLAITGHHADTPLASEGDYMFWLQDADRGDVANTVIYTVEYKPGTPSQNITTSYLEITSGESYRMISEIVYNYGIDSTNFSTGTNYFEIYNYDFDQTTQSALLSKQIAYEWGTLYPVGVYESSESYYWGGLIALPGNNTMRIRHDDLNGSTVLVYDNFTLSELNTGGYGLKLSAYDACINEMITISVTIPAASNVSIFSPYGVEIITYNMNASGTVIYYFPISGLYTIKLIPDGSVYEEATATIYISDCAEDGIIEPPSGEMDDMYMNLFNAMMLPAFWGMIIFIGFIGGLALKKNASGEALVSGNGLAFIAFGLLNLLSIVGLFAPYTFYIIVSTWIFAGMFFGVGRLLARGE